MIPKLILHDYKWMEYADVMRLASLDLLKYARRDSHVFYVNPDTDVGRDGQHSGMKYRSPLNTIEEALSKVESGRGDFVIIQASDTDITEGDIEIAKTDIVIAGMTPANMGRVTLKPSDDPSGAIFSCTNASNRIVFKNLRINGHGDGGDDVKGIRLTGKADYGEGYIIEDCIFELCGNAIVTSNTGSASDWVIRNNLLINCDNGIAGYFHHGEIYGNRIIKTVTTALTVGISLLDNTTTADSDGCMIHHNTVLGGIEGTTPMADGIKVAAACYGVGVWENRVSGCTTNITVTDNTAASHAIFNITGDGREGGGEWADAETYLNASA